jgi:hypothetical protein
LAVYIRPVYYYMGATQEMIMSPRDWDKFLKDSAAYLGVGFDETDEVGRQDVSLLCGDRPDSERPQDPPSPTT